MLSAATKYPYLSATIIAFICYMSYLIHWEYFKFHIEGTWISKNNSFLIVKENGRAQYEDIDWPLMKINSSTYRLGPFIIEVIDNLTIKIDGGKIEGLYYHKKT